MEWNAGNVNELENVPSLVGVVQVYMNKTETTLMENAIVVHPVQVVLLNVIKELRRYSINHGETLSGLLPISVTLPDEIDTTADDTDMKREEIEPLRGKIRPTSDRNAR